VKQQLRDIGTLLIASTARRSRALIVNFQAARLWELLVAAFRGWAHESVDGFRPSEDPKPQSVGWYPIIRLIRVVRPSLLSSLTIFFAARTMQLNRKYMLAFWCRVAAGKGSMETRYSRSALKRVILKRGMSSQL
jgi:hypothetical protein